MSLKITRLRTHWSADEAHLVISFLDELRDMLWETYGDKIVAMYADMAKHDLEERQTELPFDDNIEF